MVLEMSLVRSVDALDAYISWSRRKPYLIQNLELQNAIDESRQSVLKKFIAFTTHHSSSNSILNALTEVTIAWRNRSVHSLADNEVQESKWELLHKNANWIAQEFRGLDVERLMKDFTDKNPPTFKETASLIHSVQETVESLERAQFEKLDREEYLKQLVCSGLEVNVTAVTDDKRQHQRKALIGKIWGQDLPKKTTRILSFFKNLGLTEIKKYDYAVTFDESILERIINMSPTMAFEYFYTA